MALWIDLSRCQFVYKICKEFLLPIPYHGCWNILSTVSKEFLLPIVLSWLDGELGFLQLHSPYGHSYENVLCISLFCDFIISVSLQVSILYDLCIVLQKIIGQCKPSLQSSQCGLEEKFTMLGPGYTQPLDIWLCGPIFTSAAVEENVQLLWCTLHLLCLQFNFKLTLRCLRCFPCFDFFWLW